MATWDDEFDKEFYNEQEIAESDARAEAVTQEIENGHAGLLPFERSAVDA